ncbi:hypothetical protein FQR65_LT10175 [Abscondita terminalis]|nr:hypothetical protein FQR65_LT10175 [Abscondita terminalis]
MNVRVSIIQLIFCVSVNGKILLIDEDKSLCSCISLFVQQSFDNKMPLSFTSIDDNILLVPKQYEKPYTVFKLDNSNKIKFATNTQFVLFVNDFQDLHKFLKFVTYFNLAVAPKIRIVIVTNYMNTKLILRRMWKSRIINVAIIHHGRESAPVIYMSNPFEKRNLCGKTPNVIITQKCHPEVTTLRYNKHKNFNNCSIVFMNVQKNDHVTHIYILTGSNYYEIKIILKSFVFMFLIVEDFPCDKVEIFTDDIVWVSPLLKRDVAVMQNIFDHVTWGMIAITILIMSLVWWGITTLTTKHNKWNQMCLSSLMVWCLTICGVIQTPPLSRHLRSIFILYLFFVIVIQTAFNSKITNYLTLTEYSSNIKTIEDVANSQFILKMNHAIADMFNKNITQDVLYTKIQKKLIPDEHGLKESMLHKNCTAATMRHLIEKFHIDQNEKVNYFIDNSLTGPYKLYIGLGEGHFFTEYVQNVTTMLIESGCYSKTLIDFDRKYYRRFRAETPNLVVLNFQHLYQIYVIWGVGLITASVVFIIEIFICKFY